MNIKKENVSSDVAKFLAAKGKITQVPSRKIKIKHPARG
jgi:hypothetical protein